VAYFVLDNVYNNDNAVSYITETYAWVALARFRAKFAPVDTFPTNSRFSRMKRQSQKMDYTSILHIYGVDTQESKEPART
jgi:hypothetical protein